MKPQRWYRSLLISIGLFSLGTAQTVYHLPFASTGPAVGDSKKRNNTIELVVANTSNIPIWDVDVRISNAPSWLKFTATEQKLAHVKPKEELAATFSFAVEKSAPVHQEHRLQFRISTGDGQSWVKEIGIVVTAPEAFELFQNFPNPFNPTTSTAYQLPAAAHVTLKIFNLLGQEVATLVDGEQPAGYHQERFDARNLASGVYVYQLSATAVDGSRSIARQMMALDHRPITRELIFHSDRDKQYASELVRSMLTRYSIRQSMSSAGNCYDNAPAESFFATFKKGYLFWQLFQTKEQARRMIVEYLEVFYNCVRRHSSLGYKSPVAYELQQATLA